MTCPEVHLFDVHGAGRGRISPPQSVVLVAANVYFRLERASHCPRVRAHLTYMQSMGTKATAFRGSPADFHLEKQQRKGQHFTANWGRRSSDGRHSRQHERSERGDT